MTYLKADTHQHLEAAGSFALYQQFANEHGIEIAETFTQGGFTFTTLPEFFIAYDYINEQLISSPQHYYQLTYDYLQRMANDGVIYSDLMVSGAHGLMSGVPYPELIDAISRAIDDATRDHNIFATISLTTVRGEGEHYGPDHAEDWAKHAATYRDEHRYVTSFGLAGNEHHAHFASFAKAFAIAGEAGLALRAHAGEGTSAAAIRDAIEQLNIAVIDHGYAITGDPELMKEVAEKDISITTCPTSNCLLSVHEGGCKEHPLWQMCEAGIRVALGGDDNYFFNTTIADEYHLVQQAGRLSDDAMQSFTRNAIALPLVPDWLYEKIVRAYPQLAE